MSEWNTWKSRYTEVEHKNNEIVLTIEQLERELAMENVKHAWAKNNLKKLETNVLTQHEKGFNKALRKTALLFNIDIEDECFHIDKDVHNGALVPIVGIKSVEPSSSKVEKPQLQESLKD